jgi:hypothetical protein
MARILKERARKPIVEGATITVASSNNAGGIRISMYPCEGGAAYMVELSEIEAAALVSHAAAQQYRKLEKSALLATAVFVD